MSGGLLDYVIEAAELVRDTGCTPDEAYEIVIASHEYRDPVQPVVNGNVIHVNFRRTGLSDAIA